MSRALLVIASERERARAAHWVQIAPPNTRIEFKAPKRSLDQNSALWAMLTDIAQQHRHDGQRLTPDDYKVLFMHALNGEGRMVRAIDGVGWVNLGRSSSDLSREEMSDLLELIAEWGARNGIEFHGEGKGAAEKAALTAPAPLLLEHHR